MSVDHDPVRPRGSQPHISGWPRFKLGKMVATPGALALLEKHGVSPASLLSRHALGDWGDLDVDDRAANDAAIKNGSRILSAYVVNGDRFWVMTEAASDDAGLIRASTCIMLPSEY